MPRIYTQVDDNMRVKLITMIADENITIREAAKRLGLKYENAKAIYRNFRVDRRVGKIKFRRPRQGVNASAEWIGST
jgi:hypothetical protein